ncbi:MAG: porphobilinogen synthase [Halobacteria archaeon]
MPAIRPRRLRSTPLLRDLVAESDLSPRRLICPLFVDETASRPEPIPSLPGQWRWPVERVADEARGALRLGIPAVLLFGIPRRKDARGSEAWSPKGVAQRAAARIKREAPGAVVITDLCLCEYTSHGHCGPLRGGEVLNDEAVVLYAKIAVSHARAGADVVAPSGMMDGQVAAIRAGLDAAGFDRTPILAYAAKYASAFYGPFREAVKVNLRRGDRRSHQMDPRNAEEALREVALDLREGADIVMVKPALPCLDVIRRVKESFHAPVAAFQVSGEYAMLKAAPGLDPRAAALETAFAIRRAGADLLATYFAKDLARWLREE